MKKKLYCICEICQNPIIDESKGFIVKGNIYVADPVKYGGLVGNNILESKVGIIEDIKEVAYCTLCLLEVLCINKRKPKNEIDFEI